MSAEPEEYEAVVPFDRGFPDSHSRFTRIGQGSIGGKAAGLVQANAILDRNASPTSQVEVSIPRTIVISTEVFEVFMERNNLYETALSGEPDDLIAHAFVRADFPAEFVEDLMAVVSGTVGRPLAIRSSSMLEDSVAHPFAGIYQTKMVPNNQSDPAARYRSLVDAIKFVFSSTFFRAAREYIRAIGMAAIDERMAVMVEEVHGRHFGSRFYPELSGLCRSYNYYRTGRARPKEGVVTLALGLGKTIMDGGVSMSYSPAHPKARLPFSNSREMLERTQLSFWAVGMGPSPAHDPIREAEYLVEGSLADAEIDGSLENVSSTYDAQNDRFVPGVRGRGARLVDFAPIVRYESWPVNAVAGHLLEVFKREKDHPIEIEFAVTFPKSKPEPAQLVVLQVRPMQVSHEPVDVLLPETEESGRLIYSTRVMGNGAITGVRDIVYVRPDRFEGRLTLDMARDIEGINRKLRDDGKKYLLIGLGRWGTSDRWQGVPATWGQISNAAAIVESSLPGMTVEPSQGAHFFMNIESFRVAYFTVPHESRPPIDWSWIESQQVVEETDTVRHVTCERPLIIRVDGRTGSGEIRWAEREDGSAEDGQEA